MGAAYSFLRDRICHLGSESYGSILLNFSMELLLYKVLSLHRSSHGQPCLGQVLLIYFELVRFDLYVAPGNFCSSGLNRVRVLTGPFKKIR